MPPAEVQAIVDSLKDGTASDPYTALHALGHAGGPSLAPIVEPFLDSPNDPLLARMALQVLCDYWGMEAAYRPTILRFLLGVDWDLRSGSYVRLASLTAAGQLIRDNGDRELLGYVLELVRDVSGPSALRSAAYAALIVAVGKSWADVPPPTIDPVPFDQDVVRLAEQLLEPEA